MIRVRASQIFTHSKEDVVAAKKMLDSGTPFEELVTRYSTCPSKENAGDLGWMPEDNLQSIMGQEVSEADLGKIIGPVHSQYGYHILKISEIEVEKIEGPFNAEISLESANKMFPEVHTLLFKEFHIGLLRGVCRRFSNDRPARLGAFVQPLEIGDGLFEAVAQLDRRFPAQRLLRAGDIRLALARIILRQRLVDQFRG